MAILFVCSGFLAISLLIYIYKTNISQVEDVIEGGQKYYSQNVVLAGQGILHYASIFMFEWYARRYSAEGLRASVPYKTRRIFVVYYFIFMTCFFSLVLMGILQYF